MEKNSLKDRLENREEEEEERMKNISDKARKGDGGFYHQRKETQP